MEEISSSSSTNIPIPIPVSPANAAEERVKKTAEDALSQQVAPNTTRRRRRKRRAKRKMPQSTKAASPSPPCSEIEVRLNEVAGPPSSYSHKCLFQLYDKWIHLLDLRPKSQEPGSEKVISYTLTGRCKPTEINSRYPALVYDTHAILSLALMTKHPPHTQDATQRVSELSEIVIRAVSTFKSMPQKIKKEIIDLLTVVSATLKSERDLLFRRGRALPPAALVSAPLSTQNPDIVVPAQCIRVLEGLLLGLKSHDSVAVRGPRFWKESVRQTTKGAMIAAGTFIATFLERIRDFARNPNKTNTYIINELIVDYYINITTNLERLFDLTDDGLQDDVEFQFVLVFMHGLEGYLEQVFRNISVSRYRSLIETGLVPEENIHFAQEHLITAWDSIQKTIDELSKHHGLDSTIKRKLSEYKGEMKSEINSLINTKTSFKKLKILITRIFCCELNLASGSDDRHNDSSLPPKAEILIAQVERLQYVLYFKLRDPVCRWGEAHKTLIAKASQAKPNANGKQEASNARGRPSKNGNKPKRRRKTKRKAKKKTNLHKQRDAGGANQRKTDQKPQASNTPSPKPGHLETHAPSESSLAPLGAIEPQDQSEALPDTISMIKLLDDLLDSANKIDTGHLLGNQEDQQRVFVRRYSQRALQFAAQALSSTVSSAESKQLDYEQSVRVLDGCRRLLEAALTLAIARYPIDHNGQHVIATQTDSSTHLPLWGHNPILPAETLLNAGQAVPEQVRNALTEHYRLILKLSHANELLHYPGSAEARGFTQSPNNQPLCDLLARLQEGEGQDELLSAYLVPTLRLAAALIDEQWTEVSQASIDAAAAGWISENMRTEGTQQGIQENDILSGEESAIHPAEIEPLSQVKSLDDARNALQASLSLLNATTHTPVYQYAIAGDGRQTQRNYHLNTVKVHLLRLKANLDRTANTAPTPEDTRQALHETVRALRSLHLAALMNLPLFEDGIHIVDAQDSSGRSLSYCSDITRLNRRLRHARTRQDGDLGQTSIARVPDCETDLNWLRNAHSFLNNPAYQLFGHENQSDFANALIQLNSDTRQHLRLGDTPDDFTYGAESVPAGQLRQEFQSHIEDIQLRYLFPAIEVAYKTLLFGFVTEAVPRQMRESSRPF